MGGDLGLRFWDVGCEMWDVRFTKIFGINWAAFLNQSEILDLKSTIYHSLCY